MQRILVTGSAGHLGEALLRTLPERGYTVTGLDQKPSPYTTHVGSIVDADCVATCMQGVDAVLHTATLHKPHVGTHSRQAFIDTNVTGTLNLLEAALRAGVSAFIYTSTTSAFGDALRPGAQSPAAWITEDVRPLPRNIYGVTKTAAESLCELSARKDGLPVIVLRTARFFPEQDDNRQRREGFDDLNLKVNELLYRRVDLEDVVEAHVRALHRAAVLGFGRYIISATTPFEREHATQLRHDVPGVLRRLYPEYETLFRARGWRMLEGIDRVYDNTAARRDLGWNPRWDFQHALDCLRSQTKPFSQLSREVGCKGYHDTVFAEGPYPVSDRD
ncbi:MAG: NAD-dependent epimerase/dehydratase family protein [Opitutales bacterium]